MIEGVLVVLAAVALFVLTYFVGKSSGQSLLGGEPEEVDYDEEDVEPSSDIRDLTGGWREDGLKIEDDGRSADEIESDLKSKLDSFDP